MGRPAELLAAQKKARTGEKQVPRLARNDNFFQKLSKKGKGKGKSKGRSRFPEGMTERKTRATTMQKEKHGQQQCRKKAWATTNAGISPLRITRTKA
ncbi:hypothetical protein [Granulicella sp. L46]|uniref:hypothetical protein n=1 Tax=Granulicella sp. L46 TaxID=1641865 RepID=UPI00131CB9E1|nr:hypothetical protein [Granulicella sp. L46]